MHQLSPREKPHAPLFAVKMKPHSPLPVGFSGIWLGKGQITSSRSRVIWGCSLLSFYHWIMDYYFFITMGYHQRNDCKNLTQS